MGSTAEGSAADMSDERPPADAALPFDAVANLRLLAEVQRRGVDAANMVIARLTERTNTTGPTPARPAGTDQMTAMTDAFIDSVAAVATAMVPAFDQLRSPAAARRDPSAPDVLATTAAAGGSAQVELWLHNYTDEMSTDIELHLSELVHASGARLPPSCVTQRPSEPFDLTAHSSRSVDLTVAVPPDAESGCYRGIVTAANLADLWIVLQIEVRPADGEAPSDASPGDPVS